MFLRPNRVKKIELVCIKLASCIENGEYHNLENEVADILGYERKCKKTKTLEKHSKELNNILRPVLFRKRFRKLDK